MSEFLYMRLASELEAKMRNGLYKVGDKLPSLRALHEKTGASITTVYQSYMELEARALVEARQKSGFYVRPPLEGLLPLPKSGGRVSSRPRRVSINILAGILNDLALGADYLPFGVAVPGAELFPTRQLNRSLRAVAASGGNWAEAYSNVDGDLGLRRQIAKRSEVGSVNEDDIVLTNGCVDAIHLALRAVAGPGDTILLESPIYTVFLQLIEDLHMMAIEIPTHPITGIDLDAAADAVRKNKVKAALVNPNFQNPLGFEMPDESKREFLRIMSGRGIPIIEDDIYGEHYFGAVRPSTIKSLDTEGMVLLCSSFSKSVGPDLRVGWIMPGRYRDKVMRLKFNSTVASPRLNQMVISDFLSGARYERHMRRLRAALRSQAGSLMAAVAEYFPEGVRLSAPKGGVVVWVELGRKVDGLELFHAAIREGISILPGQACTSTAKYRNCIRLSFGSAWDDQMEDGIKRLGGLIGKLSL